MYGIPLISLFVWTKINSTRQEVLNGTEDIFRNLTKFCSVWARLIVSAFMHFLKCTNSQICSKRWGYPNPFELYLIQIWIVVYSCTKKFTLTSRFKSRSGPSLPFGKIGTHSGIQEHWPLSVYLNVAGRHAEDHRYQCTVEVWNTLPPEAWSCQRSHIVQW